jgi:hypothetical protein
VIPVLSLFEGFPRISCALRVPSTVMSWDEWREIGQGSVSVETTKKYGLWSRISRPCEVVKEVNAVQNLTSMMTYRNFPPTRETRDA